jgi:hypothetical protein
MMGAENGRSVRKVGYDFSGGGGGGGNTQAYNAAPIAGQRSCESVISGVYVVDCV